MAKHTTGNLLSTERPSNQEIFAAPYVLSKNQKSIEKKNFINEVGFDSAFIETRENLLMAMWHLIDLEQRKERLFVNSFLEQVKIGDPEFAQQLETILKPKIGDGPGRISLALEAIQLYRAEQWNVTQSIEQNLTYFTEYWEAISNKVFMSAVNEVSKEILNKKNRTLTISDLVDAVEQKIMNSFLSDVQDEYKPVVKKVISQVKNLARTKFGEEYDYTLKELENGTYIQRKMEKHKTKTSSKYKNESVESILMDYVGGLINGLSAEMFMEAKKLGKGTGRIGMSEKRLTKGTGSKEGRAIQTDVIEIFSTELTSPDIDMSELEKETMKTLTQMRSWLDSLDLSDKLIVHTSVKDYGAASPAIHIRGTKPLDVRLAPLAEICESINMHRGDIQNLIFALVNAGEYMIANDLYRSGLLAQALTTISATYMFEDYVDTFTQLESDTSNNELHVYFINGHYYTMSDILTQSYYQIKEKISEGKSTRGGMVKVTFLPTKENVFEDKSLDNLIGRDRWEQVRNLTLEKGRLGIALNAKQLRDMILKLEY